MSKILNFTMEGYMVLDDVDIKTVVDMGLDPDDPYEYQFTNRELLPYVNYVTFDLQTTTNPVD